MRAAVLISLCFWIFIGLMIWAADSQASPPPSGYGGGEGGYTQLPACGPIFYGQTLYVQGHYWFCPSGGTHWLLAGQSFLRVGRGVRPVRYICPDTPSGTLPATRENILYGICIRR